MYEVHRYGQPKRRFSTGLPLAATFVTMAAIAAYLLIGSASLDNGGQAVAIVLPKPALTISK
ncbi:hypothetical protein LAC79_32290 [Ensifer adhaerens]|uniref:hypothetical protein n=1 Tax=Ensifer adhaerens TaxID=106592 RepID=UPI001CBACCE9|nr:hypothetical protein [Ensifer adhaerens]MBZ7926455.1 hypothetical protein [Ensifer adhaerens]UAX97196.1 hypothetical protein LAC78_26035 [Ensifer adhaerens]